MAARKKRPEKGRGAEHWARLVAQWRRSGMTAAEFADKHSVSRTSLYWWSSELKRREAEGDADTSFVAVEVSSSEERGPAGEGQGVAMELITRSGRVIRFGGQVDADALRVVLQVAEQC